MIKRINKSIYLTILTSVVITSCMEYRRSRDYSRYYTNIGSYSCSYVNNGLEGTKIQGFRSTGMVIWSSNQYMIGSFNKAGKVDGLWVYYSDGMKLFDYWIYEDCILGKITKYAKDGSIEYESGSNANF